MAKATYKGEHKVTEYEALLWGFLKDILDDPGVREDESWLREARWMIVRLAFDTGFSDKDEAEMTAEGSPYAPLVAHMRQVLAEREAAAVES